MNKPIETLLIYIGSALAVSIVTTTVSFAWSTNTRLTKLETALVNLSQDVHDIKILLEKKRGFNG